MDSVLERYNRRQISEGCVDETSDRRSIVAAACWPESARPPLRSSAAATLTYGRYADSLFLDPVLQDANVDIWILSNLYDTLLLPTDDGKGVQPGLATEWKVADDGLTVTLTLRDGIKFSDGSPITRGRRAVVAEARCNPRPRHLGVPARLGRRT